MNNKIINAIKNNGNKVVILSINPKWLEKIKTGERTLEIRKSMPWDISFPFCVFCYETKKDGGAGKITDAFVCDKISDMDCLKSFSCISSDKVPDIVERFCNDSCLSLEELYQYGKNAGRLYGWSVNNISSCSLDVRTLGIRRVPQSWCYAFLPDSTCNQIANMV